MLAETYREKIRQTLQSVPGICFAILYGSSYTDELFRDVDIGLSIYRDQIEVDDDFEFFFR